MAAQKKPATQPPMINLIRAADVKPEKTTYLCPEWDRFPVGKLTLVGGRPGEGKSLFTNFLAGLVTRRGGAVLMSNPEDSLTTTKIPRAIAADVDQRLLHFWPGKLVLPRDVEMLEELVLFHKIELLTIDPIAKHIRSSDPNTALEPLASMAERCGVTVVGVHHLNKRLARDAHPRDAFGGANGGWLGTAREAFVFGPAEGGEEGTRFLGTVKANGRRDDEPSLEFYIDDFEVPLPNGEIEETGRVIFVKQARIDLSSAVVHYKGGAGYKDGGPEKKQVATEFLTLLLMKGPAPAQTVFDKAAEVGLSQRSVKNASQGVAVKKRRGFGPGSWIEWTLDPQHPLAKQIGAKSPRTVKPKAPATDVDGLIDEILGDE